MEIQIKLLRGAAAPAYATEGAAGLDLSSAADEDIFLPPGGRAKVPSGIAAAIPRGYVGLVFARSGLSAKHGIALANGVGVIDSDYRGEILCSMVNLGDAAYTIRRGERVAQLVFVPVPEAKLSVVDELDETERGAGGFGSTGI